MESSKALVPDWKNPSITSLEVRVTPKASSNRILAETQADGSLLVRVYITTVPEDGKANQAVIALLAKELHVSKSSLNIVRGQSSRNKLIRIDR